MKASKPRHIPKWLKWEFWPFIIFYLPVDLLILFHAIRSHTIAYITLVNPGMRLGGFASYSKAGILLQLNERYLPKTVLLHPEVNSSDVINEMKSAGISFPVILKPNEGERGWKVEKILDEAGIESYLKNAPAQLLLQEYIDYKEEYGVMYFRIPGSEKGTISSLMKREFLTVEGNGRSTLLEHFLQSERCLYHLTKLKKKYADELNTVLPAGELKVLEEIGNHNRGTTFLDVNHLINDALIKTFDEASSTLEEWYFGRFDLRTPSYNEMLKGNFKVVEVNGVNSEPAHIYDPHMSIVKAYGDLFKHWNTIYKISRANRKRGFKPESAKTLINSVIIHQRLKKRNP